MFKMSIVAPKLGLMISSTFRLTSVVSDVRFVAKYSWYDTAFHKPKPL